MSDLPKSQDKNLSDEAILQLRQLFHNVPLNRRKEIFEEQKKPTAWSNRSNAPYYKERYAIQLQTILDVMMEEYSKGIIDSRMFKYKDFNLKKSSLYLMINQAKLFLIDNMDNDNRYRKFLDNIKVKQEQEGVVLRYCKDIINDTKISLDRATPIQTLTEQQISIQVKVEEFLQNAKAGDKLELKNLSLDDDMIEALESSVNQLEDIVASISRTNLRLIKLSADDAAKLRNL